MSEGERLIGNRFTLGNVIGMGGMATVYSGIDTHTNEKVAIKLLKQDIISQDPDIVARFDREGEALRRLNHPNIVKILATVVEEDKHYVMMEFVGGGDLNTLIQEHRQNGTPIPIQRILEIALDLSDALTRAHRLKIIHRDIKPANVLLASDGTPRLTDFGVAHFSDSTKMTQTGALIGTLAYLSPEACSGDPLDGRADIWSFGVMLYELLALKRPFDDTNTAALLTSILNKTPKPISDLRPDTPPQLVYLLDQMLAKDPDNRIASARLVGAQLEAIISGGNTWDMPIADFEANLEEITDFSSATPSSLKISDYKVPPSIDHGEFVPDSAIKTPTPLSTINIPPSIIAKPKSSPKTTPWLWMSGGFMVIVALIILFFVFSSQNNNPTSQEDMPPTLEAVATNNLMVIVGQFENAGGDERNVGQVIYEDLETKFERDVPFSRIEVRFYPDVIQNAQQAQEIAIDYQAPVIIWGNYDERGINVQVQAGSIASFKHFIISIDELRRLTDVQLQLTNERRESVAPNVLAILNIFQTYNNNAYEIGRNLAILELVNTGETAQVSGNSVAARWHRYFMAYNSDEEKALQEINEAISLNNRVVLLYSARALTYTRLGRFDDMLQDLRTVQTLDDGTYLGDDMLLAQYYFWFGDESDLDEIQRLLENIVQTIPDEWWSITMLGITYWLQGDLTNAQDTLENAILLSPDANYPYVILISIYMRQGELAKAGEMIQFVRQNYPDATIANRVMNSTFNLDGVELTYATEIFSYFILGQWSSVLTVIEKANFGDSYADAYLLAGLAYCNLGDYEQAEASYTQLLTIYPDYLLGYLLRAEVKLKQENNVGALADIAVITQSNLADRFAPLIAGAQTGEISCETILDIDFSNF